MAPWKWIYKSSWLIFEGFISLIGKVRNGKLSLSSCRVPIAWNWFIGSKNTDAYLFWFYSGLHVLWFDLFGGELELFASLAVPDNYYKQVLTYEIIKFIPVESLLLQSFWVYLPIIVIVYIWILPYFLI